MKKAIGAVALVALAFAGVALAAAQGDSYKVSATLKARTEVPKPTGVPAGATGSFTGTAVELANDKAKVTWKLTLMAANGPLRGRSSSASASLRCVYIRKLHECLTNRINNHIGLADVNILIACPRDVVFYVTDFINCIHRFHS